MNEFLQRKFRDSLRSLRAAFARGLFFSIFLFHADQDVADFIESFRQHRQPIVEINFSGLYGGSGKFQVLHPLLEMERLRYEKPARACGGLEVEDDPVPMRNLFFDNNPLAEKASTVPSTKRQAIKRLAIKLEPLPEDFITTPPYVDPQGWSYAYLLIHYDLKPYNEKAWVERHLTFFKLSELKEVLQRFEIENPVFSALSRLNENEIEEVVRGSPLVLSKDYLLVRNQSRLGFSPLSYWVYDIRDLEAELKGGRYDLVPAAADAICLQRIGNACWTYSSQHALSYLYRYSLTIVVLGGLLVAVVLAWWLWRWSVKRSEHERSRLALQVLSHEFRTPVSSMLLLLEQLAQSRGGIRQEDQDLITRLSAETYRLQRIIEVSKNYLQAEGRRIRLREIEIPSLNQWTSDFCQEWREKGYEIDCQPLASDQSIKTDPFWLQFVLSNLVQNAFAHGQAPVVMRVSQARGAVRVTVEDQGECDFATLGAMTDPFVKSARSQGMGLGLNITQTILEELGGRLEFSRRPTAFTLNLELD